MAKRIAFCRFGLTLWDILSQEPQSTVKDTISRTKEKTQEVGVITKVLRILEAIQASPAGLGLSSICEITEINKSTAHRFLKHLEREGFLIRMQSRLYLLGPRFSQMTAHVNQSAVLQAVARPPLWELWQATHETVNLAVLDRGTVLYSDVIESPHEFRLSSRIGSRRPLHATALGKVLGAYSPEEQQSALLNSLVFQPMTPNTIMNLLQFREELERVRVRGYAVDDEEVVLGARCVAAPVLGLNGTAIAAVSVSGPTTRVTAAQVPPLAAAVVKCAFTISSGMGFPQKQTEPPSQRHSRDHDVSSAAG